MPDPQTASLLTHVLERAQAEGALGARPIAEVIQHARFFVNALPEEVRSVMDLGSGAGIPGLVVALDRPLIRVTLVDRRAKRVDALRRAVTSLGWTDRVAVLEADADHVGRDERWSGTQDAVVARGFGEPAVTLPIARRLVRPGGWVVISEPPTDTGSRWDPTWVRSLGMNPPERLGSVVRFHVEQSTPEIR